MRAPAAAVLPRAARRARIRLDAAAALLNQNPHLPVFANLFPTWRTAVRHGAARGTREGDRPVKVRCAARFPPIHAAWVTPTHQILHELAPGRSQGPQCGQGAGWRAFAGAGSGLDWLSDGQGVRAPPGRIARIAAPDTALREGAGTRRGWRGADSPRLPTTAAKRA